MTPIDEHRAFLEATWALTLDMKGRETLIGLTVDETAEYFRVWQSDDPADRDRYLELSEKHEAARQALIYTESGDPDKRPV